MLADKRKLIVAFALLAVAVVVAYLPALTGDFIWDDDQYVVENETLRSWDGLLRMWTEMRSIPQWYPLVHTTFWFEFQVFGLTPTAFHITNLLLHLAGVIVMFQVLRQLNIPGAFAACAVFALHPVGVESVAWITERKNVLSLLFYLLSLSAWLRFAPLTSGMAERPPWRTYILSLGFFVCALLSKTVTCSLPAAILLLIWWRRGLRFDGRELLALLPFFVIGITLALNTASLEKAHVGASGEEWDLSFVERTLVAGRALCFYAGKIIWPHPLTFIYEKWTPDDTVAWQYAFPVAWAVLLLTALLLIKRIGRGSLTALLIFSGTLVPALGFFAVYPHRYAYVADHFQHHASLALIVLLVGIAATWIPRKAGLPVLLVVLAALGVRTWFQAHKYQGLEALYQSILDDVPDSWFAHNNLGVERVREGRIDEALQRFSRAKELHPILEGRHLTPKAYSLGQLGSCMTSEFSPKLGAAFKEMQALMGQFQQLVATGGMQDPGRRPQAEQMKTQIHALEKRVIALRAQLRKAADWLEKAIKEAPDYPKALGNLGPALAQLSVTSPEGAKLQDFNRAERLLRRAYELGKGKREHDSIGSNLVKMYQNKITLLGQQGRTFDVQQYRQRLHELVQELRSRR